MASARKTIEGHHKKRHYRNYLAGETPAECWHCQRNVAICHSKRSYRNRDEAAAAAKEINIAQDWESPLYPYPCIYCELHHLATARRQYNVKRAERQRRKWLISQLNESAPKR